MSSRNWIIGGLMFAGLISAALAGGSMVAFTVYASVSAAPPAPSTTSSTLNPPSSALHPPLPAAKVAANGAFPNLPAAKDHPASVDDLRAIEKRVEAVTKKNMTSVVGLAVGGAQGSGVIVDGDGTILTAGHVAADPGTPIIVILSDGRRVRGKTLGSNNGIDSGMAQITEKPKEGGEWPHVELGTSAGLTSGEWVMALGHPGGYHAGRPPVVRLGRVLLANKQMIGTDCVLMSGDSGGPLFDLDGKLVGIHSRIGVASAQNIHVPIDTFTQTWDRLAAGETWGNGLADVRGGGGLRRATPSLGATAVEDDKGMKLTEVKPESAAEKGGLKVGDVLQKVDGAAVHNRQDLIAAIYSRKPGDVVKLAVLRAEKAVEVEVKLGRLP